MGEGGWRVESCMYKAMLARWGARRMERPLRGPELEEGGVLESARGYVSVLEQRLGMCIPTFIMHDLSPLLCLTVHEAREWL